ncbi:hypothetical protein AB0O31_01095 [Kitasatospora cineracea]
MAGAWAGLAAARPAHARAVRRALLAPADAPGADAFWDVLHRVAAPPGP